MSGANEKTPWKDGYWGGDGVVVLNVKGSVVITIHMPEFVQGYEDSEKQGKWMFGEFGKASNELKSYTGGISEYNLKMVLDFTRFWR